MTDARTGTWHVARWPALAWAETAVKGAAQAVGIAALVAAAGDELTWPGGRVGVELVVLAVMSLGLLGAIGDRVVEREVVSMIFVITNNAAHWGMVVALATLPGPGRLAPVFFALMLAGELVKLAFLRTSGYRVRDVSPAVVAGLTAAYGAGYALLVILELA